VSASARVAFDARRKKSGDVAILWNSGHTLIYQPTIPYTLTVM
jgi:hypothetical protein